MNIETARFNMIEQQIRPWDVLDQTVLDLLSVVRREEFVPPAYRSLAFVDMEIPLPHGENMLAPKVEARLLQELTLSPVDTVLEIGTGSGYMAALLAGKAARVLSVEIDDELRAFASANLTRAGVRNVSVVAGDGAAGFAEAGEVDAVVVSGSLPFVPDTMLKQLRPGGRLVAIVGDPPIMTAQLIHRIADGSYETLNLFETFAKPLRNARQPVRFTF